MTCTPFNHCFDFANQNRPIVTFSDRKSATTFTYENRSLDCLTKYRVDGCLINDAGCKCDYLLLNCSREKSYFIELKGSDLIKAVEQVDRSIDILHQQIINFTVEVRIVLTRVNTTDLRNTKFIKLEKRVKQLNGKLIKQTRQLVEIN
jgi:hypothetical protein